MTPTCLLSAEFSVSATESKKEVLTRETFALFIIGRNFEATEDDLLRRH